MSDTNCPNCGAPKTGSVCEYCGTHFQRYQGEATVEVEPDGVDIYGWDGSIVAHISETVRQIITVNEYTQTYGTVKRR